MPEVKIAAQSGRAGAAKAGAASRAEPPRTPRTQQQRREETRRALLDAAVESLIEVGFARTTTLEVQRRAGVSRGALLHHFPSKAELLVAAVDHLAEMRAREMKAFASELPPDESEVHDYDAVPDPRDATRGGGKGPASPDQRGREGPLKIDPRTNMVLDLLWQCFSGTFFKVSMELRTAARTDPELRRVLTSAEVALRDRIVAQSRTLFGKAIAEHPNLPRALDLTLQLMIGAAMTAVLHESPHLDQLIGDWKALFPLVLAHAGSTPPDPKRLKGKR